MAVPRLNPVYGFAKAWGWRPRAGNYVGTGAAAGFNPKSKWHNEGSIPAAGAGLASPPTGTFDPALEAQRRAAQRGMHDTLQDVASKEHFAEHDLATALRSIKTEARRGRQNLGIKRSDSQRELDTDRERGLERIGNQEADTKRSAGRQTEDFNTQLANIGRQFQELGHRQGEAANAAGVNDQGTSAAAAAARAQNQIRSEEPIHTAQTRLNEDLATTLGRLGISRDQLESDYGVKVSDLERDYAIASSQLKQDRDFNREKAKTQAGRELFEDKRTGQRARREGAITNLDLLEEEIYQARKEHPGAFSASQNKGGAAAQPKKKKGK